MPIDPGPGYRDVRNGDLIRSWPHHEVYAYWNYRKHWIIGPGPFEATFGATAYALIYDIDIGTLSGIATGRVIAGPADWEAILGGQWAEPAPPPPPPAPTPPRPKPRVDAGVFIGEFPLLSEAEIEAACGPVCRGELLLTRGGVVLQPHQWPTVVRAVCEVPPLEPEPAPDELEFFALEARNLDYAVEHANAVFVAELQRAGRAINLESKELQEFARDVAAAR